MISENYSSLFSKSNDEESYFSINDDQSHKYRWVSFIDRLTNGDITKTDEVYKRTYIETLNLLSFYKIRDDKIKMEQQINKRR